MFYLIYIFIILLIYIVCKDLFFYVFFNFGVLKVLGVIGWDNIFLYFMIIYVLEKVLLFEGVVRGVNLVFFILLIFLLLWLL